MKNAIFMLRSEADKTDSMRKMLWHRSNRTLTDEQLRILMLTLRTDRQYTVVIYTDASSFCEASVLVENGEETDQGKVVFGRTLFGKATETGYREAELFTPDEPVAVVITKRRLNRNGMRTSNVLNLYIPERMYLRNGAAYAGKKAQHCV